VPDPLIGLEELDKTGIFSLMTVSLGTNNILGIFN